MRDLLILTGAGLAVAALSACATLRAPDPAPAPAPQPAPIATTAPPAGPAPFTVRWDGEPVAAVFIHQAPTITFTTLTPLRLPDGATLPAGSHNAQHALGMVRLDDRAWPAPLELTAAGDGPTARVALPDAKDFTLRGGLRLAIDGREVELIERIPLERYLQAVVTKEMRPDWPVAALAAQAVAARSYAAARLVERKDHPWQLHRSFRVDMAYPGWARDPGARVTEAVQRTRGLLLESKDQPLPALFHAASGGRTEDCANIWPNRTLPDGTTKLAEAIAAVDDEVSQRGARALGMDKTHAAWRATFTYAGISTELQAWAAQESARPRIGTVTAVTIKDRLPGSQRVAKLVLTHRRDGKVQHAQLSGQQFREAVGPVDLRSLWWDKITPTKTGIVIEGRGFGHGVGLSQTGAWQLATDGADERRILATYYPKAALATRW